MSDGSKYRRSRGVASSVAALGVVCLVLAAGLVYVELSPVQTSGGGGATRTSTVVSTITSTVNSVATVTQTSTVQTTSFADLVTLAKAEGGTLTDYSIIAPESYNNYYLPNFTKAYPWAKVNYVSLDPAGTITRPTSELKAGKVVADVLEIGNLGRVITDVNNGVCAPVNLTNWLVSQGYSSGTYDKAGYWYSSSITPQVMFYNTNLLSPSQAPTAYTDLANPIYKGKIAIDSPSALGTSGGIFASLSTTMSNASWTQLMANIASNGIAYQTSGGTVQTVVSQGQYAIGLDTINGVLNSIKGGLPVKIVWTNPVYLGVSGLCIATQAPHPNMALLYAMWETSVFGQTTISKGLGFASAIQPVTSYGLRGIIPSNATLKAAITQVADYYSNPQKWANIFVSIFGR